MRLAALPAALCLCLALPALAETPYPTVDFEGDWVMEAEGTGSIRATMRYRADGRKMRIEMDQAGMAMTSVQDMGAGEMVMWSDQMPGMGMRVRADPDLVDPRRTEETGDFAGEACTIWVFEGVRSCLTDDNIPLQVSGPGFAARLENMRRAAQDPGLFAPPAGLQIMDMPAGMPGSEGMPTGLPF